MTGAVPPGNPGRRGQLALVALLLTTFALSGARIAMALADGTITDKHGHAWSRAADPGHFWLLLIPWITMMVIPGGVVVALLRGAARRPQ